MVSCEIPEVERILEEFSRCANKVRTCTEVILRCVDEGCVPDQESIFSFQNCLQNLIQLINYFMLELIIKKRIYL